MLKLTSGELIVIGLPFPALTELEYRLMVDAFIGVSCKFLDEEDDAALVQY